MRACPKCRGEAERLELSEPGDARIALPRDYELLLEALQREFGDAARRFFSALSGRSPALLNKVPYFDEMREVYVDGRSVGRLYFDPFLRKWRFRPSKAGAVALLEADPDAVEKVVVTRAKILPPRLISLGRDVEKGRAVLLVRENWEPVGLAYSLGGGRARVHSWWGDSRIREPPSSKSTLDDVLEAHRDHLRILEAKAAKTIAVYAERLGGPTIVSFSGGKDSHIALHIALKTGVEPQVLFNDTKLELPETLETVTRVVEENGLELVVAEPEADFWESLKVFGPPARDYRWCCKICKLTPLARVVKKRWAGGALNIVAQRAYESIDRARGSIAWRLRWAPYVLNVSPIMYWTQFEEWLYIISENLRVNPLYYMGYERIGCFMCPASYLAEFDLVSRTHPDLWAKWTRALEEWTEKLGAPREYVDYALWRWHSPAGHRESMARKLGLSSLLDDWQRLYRARVRLIREVERSENTLKITLSEPLDLEAFENQLSILKPRRLEVEHGLLEAGWDSATLRAKGSQLELAYSSDGGLETALDSIKSYYRWRECVGCLSCETICPTGAIRVEKTGGRPRPRVDSSRCVSCRLCLRNCPIAEVFGEHVLAPVLLGDLYAWTRASRETHEEVLERARAMLASKPQELSQEARVSGEPPEGLADFLSSY